MTPKIWWYLARSTGLVAWAVAAASVVWGLLLSTRSARGVAKPAWVLDLHRHLGMLALVLTGVHLGALVADTYVAFGPADLFVPFASSWKPGAVASGVVAFWLLVAVEVTSLLKSRLPHRWWTRVHLSSFAVYVLATLHLLTAGTEGTNVAVVVTAEIVTAIVLFLTVLRVLAPRRRAGARSRAATAPGRSATVAG